MKRGNRIVRVCLAILFVVALGVAFVLAPTGGAAWGWPFEAVTQPHGVPIREATGWSFFPDEAVVLVCSKSAAVVGAIDLRSAAVDWLCGASVAGLILLGLRRRKRRTPEHRACPQCGYNLTGNISGRCSECGFSIEEASDVGQ
ncbi:MAG: hypothetical protein HZB38_07820 [Planctomycetes bacterium]|nr:hypothetical protein [Planctomycetota bacterium]